MTGQGLDGSRVRADVPTREQTYAYAVVSRLVEHGIDTVFAIPGTHNLELFRALDDLGVRVVPAHHEQGLGYAADAFSRVSEGPSVVLTTTGPGLTNLITALATSAAASVPVLAIAPGLPEAALGGSSGWLHELPDQLGLLRQVVRAHRAASSADALRFIDECVAAWSSERPLPAYLELPLDELSGPASLVTLPLSRTEPRETNIEGPLREAASVLSRAERPLIIAGRGACSSAAARSLCRIAEQLGAPVLTTANAKGAIDERHPLAVGVALRTAAARGMIAASDGLLVIGSDLGPSEFWGAPEFPLGNTVRIDAESMNMRANMRPDVELLGRAEELGGALADLLTLSDVGREPEAPLAPVLPSWAVPHQEAIRAGLADDGAPYRVFHEVMQEETAGLDIVITGDSSQVSYLGTASFWVSRRANRFLYPAGFGTLGYAVPAAVGAALTGVADRVIAVTGEGGLLFSVQELATVAELGLDIVTVVFVNGGYQEIRDGMDSLAITPVGVGFASPDFAALARSFRLASASVVADGAAEQGFRAAFRRALESNGPTVIEVRLPGNDGIPG